jgi:hypothetical protein
MKVLLFCIAVLGLAQSVSAHTQSPPDLATIAHSDTIYLVEVDSITATQGDVAESITVSVLETLRGKPVLSMTLEPYGVRDFTTTGTKWILFRHPGGGFKDCVGWATKGDCDWIPISVTPNLGIGCARYRFSVDQIRNYLNQHPLSSTGSR